MVLTVVCLSASYDHKWFQWAIWNNANIGQTKTWANANIGQSDSLQTWEIWLKGLTWHTITMVTEILWVWEQIWFSCFVKGWPYHCFRHQTHFYTIDFHFNPENNNLITAGFKSFISILEPCMMTQNHLQTPSDWRKPALKATGVDLGAQKTILECCLCVGRAGSIWVAQPRWVAQVQTHCARPTLFGSRSPGGSLGLNLGRAALKPCLRSPEVCNRPSILQIRLGANEIGSNELVWPLYTSQISSQSDFISNPTLNPHYKYFCNFHFGFLNTNFALASLRSILMILLSFCRDMAVLARGKTRGLLLQCLHDGTITNLLQNDNDKFLVPKQSFGLEMFSFF